MTTRRAKKWVFTINDNARVWAESLMQLKYEGSKHIIQYICGQLEVAPETGRLHFQGYCQLKKTQRMSFMKNNVHPTAHWEAQKAKDNRLARDYCRKEETRAEGGEFLEFGDFIQGPGQRTDLIELRDAVKRGVSRRQMAEDYLQPYSKYWKFISHLRPYYPPDAHTEPIEICLYVGAPGTGKTWKARNENPNLYVSPISNGTFWIDGYDYHETVLLDDFSGALSKVALVNTLNILDDYFILGPVKGAHDWWCPKKIIVTTNIHPFLWYKWEGREYQYESLHRRFTQVLYFPRSTAAERAEPEEQSLPDFFYDEELIYVTEERLLRPLPELRSFPGLD